MGERARILVVDDVPRNAALLEAMLLPEGHEVVAVHSGAEALEEIAARPPHLALLDVLMPEMDGIEVLRAIRVQPELEGLPVLMVTAGEGERRIAALDAGADDFVQKPVERAELIARVRSLLRISRYHQTISRQAQELAVLNRDLEARVAAQVEEIERLGRLRPFLPPVVAERVTAGDHAILDSHRAEVAVLVAGLTQFADFERDAAPEEVIRVLGEFHEAAGGLVLGHDATLGSFLGDRIMMFLNDPLPSPDPAGEAARLALALRELAANLGVGWRRAGHALGFGAGLAFGFATVGRMGFARRFDYGPIGPVVTLASALFEAATVDQVLIEPRAFSAIEDQFVFEDLPEPVAPGRTEGIMIRQLVGRRSKSGSPEGLTEREVEVLGLVADGLSNRQIAERLVISEKTAIRHVSNIFGKLRVNTRAQATRIAMERGLTGSPASR